MSYSTNYVEVHGEDHLKIRCDFEYSFTLIYRYVNFHANLVLFMVRLLIHLRFLIASKMEKQVNRTRTTLNYGAMLKIHFEYRRDRCNW